MKLIDFNCYGESLDSTPGFFLMKKQYEEELELLEYINSVDFLEEQTDFTIFVDPINLEENNLNKLKENEESEEKFL